MKNLKSLAILPVGKYEVTDAKGNVQYQEDGVTPMTITHHSPGTKQFQNAFHDFKAKKSGGLAALMGGKEDKRAADADVKDLAVFLAAITISFDGFEYEGMRGNAQFRAAYEDIEIGHVAEGLNKFAGDRGNYLPEQATTSSDSSASQPG
jgi:hypothetical protein